MSLVTFTICAVVIGFGGCGKSQKIAGLGEFKFDIVSRRVVASLALTKISFDYGVRLPIPQLEEGFFEIAPDFQSSGTLVVFSVPIESMVKAVTKEPMTLKSLPDGRQIFGVTRGVLPGFDQKFDRFKIRFYLDKDVFGFFIPVQLPAFGSDPVTISIKDGRGYQVARAFVIPQNKSQEISGVLLLFPYIQHTAAATPSSIKE